MLKGLISINTKADREKRQAMMDDIKELTKLLKRDNYLKEIVEAVKLKQQLDSIVSLLNHERDIMCDVPIVSNDMQDKYNLDRYSALAHVIASFMDMEKENKKQ